MATLAIENIESFNLSFEFFKGEFMKAVLCVFLLLSISRLGFAQSTFDPEPSFNYCVGYNSLGGMVTGSCNNGMVFAQDDQTGATITGSCSANGSFQAFEPVDGGMIYGSCQ